MTEMESVITGVCSAIKACGVGNVFPAYPYGTGERYLSPVVTVGVKAGSGMGASFAEYLGESYDRETDRYTEIYGKRLEITLALGIYSPVSEEYGANGCASVFGDIVSALPALPSGVKTREIKCGETVFDEKTGMFLLESEIRLTAFLTAEASDEDEVLDFTLRGTVK